MKRRNADSGKIRRPVKRNKEGMGSNTLLYFKFLILWAIVITADFLLEFRFEYLWPFWLLLRSVHDSFKYKGLAFSVLFVCIAITSDLVCLFFIPVHWLFFAASTYVWVQYVWHTDKGICLPTIILWVLFVYLEACIRWKDNKSIPHLDICRPFAAHCIGYPVVTLGFGFKSYVGYRIRQRKQREVAKENEFYMQLLQQALPKEEQSRGSTVATRNQLAHQQEHEQNNHNSKDLSNTSSPNITNPTAVTNNNNSIHKNTQSNSSSSANNNNSSCNNTSSNKLLNNLTNLITTNGHLILGGTSNPTTPVTGATNAATISLGTSTSIATTSNISSVSNVTSVVSANLNGGVVSKNKKCADSKCDLNNVNNIKLNNSSYHQNPSSVSTALTTATVLSTGAPVQNGCVKDVNKVNDILTTNGVQNSGPNISVNMSTATSNNKESNNPNHHNRSENKLNNNSYSSTAATADNNNLPSSTNINNNNKFSLNNNSHNHDHNNCDKERNTTKLPNGHVLNNINESDAGDTLEQASSQKPQQQSDGGSTSNTSTTTTISAATATAATSPNVSSNVNSNNNNGNSDMCETVTNDKVKSKKNRFKQKDSNTKDNQNHNQHHNNHHHNSSSSQQQSLNNNSTNNNLNNNNVNNTHDSVTNSSANATTTSKICDSCLRLENEQKKLKQELNHLKNNESELKHRANISISLKTCLQAKQKEIDEFHNKIHEYSNTRQMDKQNLQTIERRLNEERRHRQSIEAQLNNERKHRKQIEEKAVRNECGENCKLRKQQLENELNKLHRELMSCEDIKRNIENQNRSYEQELRKFEAELRAREAQQGTEVLMTALQALQDKNSTLEKNLSAETRVKLDLFSALGEVKRQLEIKDSTIRSKDKEVLDLRAKIAQLFAVMPPLMNDCLSSVTSPVSNSSILRLNEGQQLLSSSQSKSQNQQQQQQQQQQSQQQQQQQSQQQPQLQHHQLNSDSSMANTLRRMSASPLIGLQMNNLGVFTNAASLPSTSSLSIATQISQNNQHSKLLLQHQQQQQQQQQKPQGNSNSVLDPNATVYTPKSTSLIGGSAEA